MASKRNGVLVITLSNIGDVILTTPVIASLRATFPEARLTVVVGLRAASLLEGSSLIDRLLIYDKEGGWSHKIDLIRSLRKEIYECVVDLKNTLFPFLVQARQRSPFSRNFRSLNARDRHLEVLQMMKLPIRGSHSFDFFSKSDETSLLEKLNEKGWNLSQPYALVSPGARSEQKRWRLEGFCEVVERLLEVSPLKIVIVGDSKERALGQKLCEVNLKRILNLAGETTLRELGALVSRSKLVLSNDSAVMHLGYELYRPVVAIFGPTDAQRYGRENKIWRLVREPFLENLSSEKVFQACEELLGAIPCG